MKKFRWFLITLIVGIFVLLVALYSYHIIYFSILSYRDNCLNITLPEGTRIAGYIETKTTNNKTEVNEIVITGEEWSDSFNRTAAHEMTHINQINECRYHSCSQSFSRVLDEMEAYWNGYFKRDELAEKYYQYIVNYGAK